MDPRGTMEVDARLRLRRDPVSKRLYVANNICLSKDIQSTTFDGQPDPLTAKALANLADGLDVFAFAKQCAAMREI